MSNVTDSGDSTYYYRGQVENNYIKLSEDDDMVWRVVRINEDGTTRIVLEDSPIEGPINLSYDNEVHMYYTNSNVSGGAMKTLNDWYDANLSLYDGKIATSTYCESLVLYTGLRDGDSYEVLDGFKCPIDENDKGEFTSKIGMLSLTEVMHAGGIYVQSADYYLVEDKTFWTITPAGIRDNDVGSYRVMEKGNVGNRDVDAVYILRPVISLNANVLVTGSGTDIDPWVVQ